MKNNPPQPIYLKDYQPPQWDFTRVKLLFELGKSTAVTAEYHIRYRNEKNEKKGEFREKLVLYGKDLELDYLSVNGKRLNSTEFRLEGEKLTIPVQVESLVLVVKTKIYPFKNTQLEGLYQSGEILCTQCEPEGFRKIVYSPDRPDIMMKYTTRIEADKDKYPVLLANGNLLEEGELPDNKHFKTWEDPFRKPSYLFALVAGNLACYRDHFTTRSKNIVDIEIYVEPEDINKCEYAALSLKRAMKWDEERFNREYDLDNYKIVAVSSFNHGAMENKGLNIFNSKYVLARVDIADDSDFMGIESVIAHEYFHNWTGNRVTLRDWFHLSLKEGLTVFRDQEFTSDLNSRAVKRLEDAKYIRDYQFAEDKSPMSHPVRPESYIEMNNFYTITVYYKGAEIIRMLHTILGEELFQQGMELYFELYDGKAVIIEDFINCHAQVSGRDFSQFLDWYRLAGTPALIVQMRYDEVEETCSLAFTQDLPASSPSAEISSLHIPLKINLVGSEGQLPLKLKSASGGQFDEDRNLLELRSKKSTFVFKNIGELPVPAIGEEFTAPVKIKYDRNISDLNRLVKNSSDPFVRWDSMQKITTEIILNGLDLSTTKLQNQSSVTKVAKALKSVLTDDKLDDYFKAQMLVLPSQSALWGEYKENIPVDSIWKTGENLKIILADHLNEIFAEIVESYKDEGGEIPSFEQISRRRLKNTALAYLALTADNSFFDKLSEKLENHGNFTDKLVYLTILNNNNNPHRNLSLDYFYRKYKDNFLVLNKWMAIQASGKLPDTLERVKNILNSSDFNLKNPNQVHSLLNVFAANKPHFHKINGDGYIFISRIIQKLDAINPVVAASLVSYFTGWREHIPERQKLIITELEKILQLKQLSPGVYEKVKRSLKS
ncbi:MAG: aminopeptidase N [Myxococcota bacterium]